MNSAELITDKQPDFLLTIHFPVGATNPQRFFATASECIEALQSCDRMLLKSFPTSIKPVFVIEQVETGSLKIWLYQLLEAVDDDALKNIDWKPAVGKYLVKGKHLLLKKLEGRKTLPPKEVLQEVADGLHQLAKESDVLRLPAYSRITEVSIAEQAKIISDSIARLEPGESISFGGDDGEAVIDADFSVTDDDITNLLVSQTLVSVREIILMVRKPDFLGESKWEFRFDRKNMSVSIADKDWLSEYQDGKKDIRPGDALRVNMRESVSYDANGEVVNVEREIVEVLEIKRKQEQATLF